jgi:hypothetical protein
MTTINLDLHNRLEPQRAHRADLQRGFAAEVADPVWFLGRQWQMGEHQGENAASPALAIIRYTRRPIGAAPGRPGQFPGRPLGETDATMPLTPAEAIIEGEVDDWWTYGRRIRTGLALAPLADALPPAVQATLRFWSPPAAGEAERPLPLPAEYAEFVDGYDGRRLWACRGDLGLADDLFQAALGALPPQERSDHWQPADFLYRAEFPIADTPVILRAAAHDGGDVDWWSVDASQALPAPDASHETEVQPVRFNYPGAPHPRWWQIEDADVDIGGFPPDRSHFPTMLLLDLILTHSNDWFTFPVDEYVPAAPVSQVGSVLSIDGLTVLDVFGTAWNSTEHPLLQPPADWSLFRVDGLGSESLVVWPVAHAPLSGVPLEEIAFGVDEDANLAWAVEERAEGHRIAPLAIAPPPDPQVTPNPDLTVVTRQNYLYRPSSFVPHGWHPYLIDQESSPRRYIQGRIADYTSADPANLGHLSPEPIARLLGMDDGACQAIASVHTVNPVALPVTGLRLERRYMLARRSDGAPVLWVQRRRLPLLSPPESGLRFDLMTDMHS